MTSKDKYATVPRQEGMCGGARV